MTEPQPGLQKLPGVPPDGKLQPRQNLCTHLLRVQCSLTWKLPLVFMSWRRISLSLYIEQARMP